MRDNVMVDHTATPSLTALPTRALTAIPTRPPGWIPVTHLPASVRPVADKSSWAWNWDALTALGTLLLAVVTAWAVFVSLRTTKADRRQAEKDRKQAELDRGAADAKAAESIRRDAAVADRAVLTAALRQAGMSYSECSTSLLEDAPSRAYGEWKVSVRSIQRDGFFPDLPVNDEQIEIVGVVVRDRAAGRDRFGRLHFRDEVIDEIATVLARAHAMSWQEYEQQRGLVR